TFRIHPRHPVRRRGREEPRTGAASYFLCPCCLSRLLGPLPPLWRRFFGLPSAALLPSPSPPGPLGDLDLEDRIRDQRSRSEIRRARAHASNKVFLSSSTNGNKSRCLRHIS